MFNFLIIGSFMDLLGIVLAVVICLLLTLLANYKDNWIFGTLMLAASIQTLSIIYHFDLLGWAKGHPWQLLGYIAAYLAAGIIYAMVKWAVKVKTASNEYETIKAHFLAKHKATEMTHPLKIKWTEKYKYSSITRKPDFSENIDYVLTWAWLWPFSIIASAFGDWTYRLYRSVLIAFESTFERITNKLWKDNTADFLP